MSDKYLGDGAGTRESPASTEGSVLLRYRESSQPFRSRRRVSLTRRAIPVTDALDGYSNARPGRTASLA